MKALAVLVVLVGTSCVVTKREVPDLVAAEASSKAQFERLKGLAGRWVSTPQPGSDQTVIESIWRVTGAGTVIEERLFAGTEHEMVSMIHRDGPYLMMTHYCSAGNQPRMRAQYTTPPMAASGHGLVEFDYLDATNLASPDDMHMVNVRYELADAAHFRSRWTAEVNGKTPDHVADFAFTRQP